MVIGFKHPNRTFTIICFLCSYSLFRSWGRVGTEIGGNKVEVKLYHLFDHILLIVGLCFIRILAGIVMKL